MIPLTAAQRANRRWFQRIREIKGITGYIELPKECTRILDMAVAVAPDGEVLIVLTDAGAFYLDDGKFSRIEYAP